MKSSWFLVSVIAVLFLVAGCTNKEKEKQDVDINNADIVFGKWDLDYQGAVGDTYPINLIFISTISDGLEVDSIKFSNDSNLKVDSIDLKQGDLMDDGRTLYNLTLNTTAVESGEYSTRKIDVSFKNGISKSYEIGNLHWDISKSKSSEELAPDKGYVVMYPNMEKYTIDLVNNSDYDMKIKGISTDNQNLKLADILVNGEDISESAHISPGQHAEIHAKITTDDQQYQFYSISPKVMYTMNNEAKESVLPSSIYGLMSITSDTVKKMIEPK